MLCSRPTWPQDGAFSTGVDVGHTYDAPGPYRVTLVVRDLDGGVRGYATPVVVGVASADPAAVPALPVSGVSTDP